MFSDLNFAMKYQIRGPCVGSLFTFVHLGLELLLTKLILLRSLTARAGASPEPRPCKDLFGAWGIHFAGQSISRLYESAGSDPGQRVAR